MIKETKVNKEVTERQKFCDVCGEEITIGLRCSVARCEYCKKDLCSDCVGHEVATGGDYRVVYCKSCWEIGNEYRPIIDDLEVRIEYLFGEWREKCDK